MKVGVTVSTGDAEHVAAIARDAGLHPVLLPCIEIDAMLAAGSIDGSGADWIIATSRRAVTMLWPDRVPAVPFITVGSRTADAVRARGGQVAVEAAGTVASMLNQIEIVQPGSSVLFPRADGASPVTASALRSQGASVDDPVVYRVRPVAPPPHLVDAVAFASPSAVRGWTMSRSLSGLRVGAIGPTTAEAVRAAQGCEAVQPPHPSFVQLFQTLGATS